MYEGFPGEVKTFFVRGLMFPNEKVFSSSLAHGAVGSVGFSSPLGVALHSETAGSFCFSAIPLHDVGSLGVEVFVVFLPPPSATPNSDKRSDGRCNRWMGGRRKEGHTHHRMNRMACPWAL